MNKIMKQPKTIDWKKATKLKSVKNFPVGVEKKKCNVVEQEALLMQRNRTSTLSAEIV